MATSPVTGVYKARRIIPSGKPLPLRPGIWKTDELGQPSDEWVYLYNLVEFAKPPHESVRWDLAEPLQRGIQYPVLAVPLWRAEDGREVFAGSVVAVEYESEVPSKPVALGLLN